MLRVLEWPRIKSRLRHQPQNQRFRNVNELILKRLGVSNGFPVSYLNTEFQEDSSRSTDFSGSHKFEQLLAQI